MFGGCASRGRAGGVGYQGGQLLRILLLLFLLLGPYVSDELLLLCSHFLELLLLELGILLLLLLPFSSPLQQLVNIHGGILVVVGPE